jgi:hypothetical protein
MNDTNILLNGPGDRRRWLLTKALEENIPLAKALQLAQAAEEFLTGSASGITASDWGSHLEVAPSGGEYKEITVRPGGFDALSSIVSLDDLLRYLRQSGENVVPETGGKFLVGGCFTESAEELLVRANRKRREQGLPNFVLLSDANAGKAAEREKSAVVAKPGPKRPPSAAERAEWARRALDLPA